MFSPRARATLVSILLLVPPAFAARASAQWAPDGARFCTSPEDQLNGDLVADGAGGAFACWTQFDRNTGDDDIWVQRFTAQGTIANTP